MFNFGDNVDRDTVDRVERAGDSRDEHLDYVDRDTVGKVERAGDSRDEHLDCVDRDTVGKVERAGDGQLLTNRRQSRQWTFSRFWQLSPLSPVCAGLCTTKSIAPVLHYCSAGGKYVVSVCGCVCLST